MSAQGYAMQPLVKRTSTEELENFLKRQLATRARLALDQDSLKLAAEAAALGES